jgi:hypothetical protein
MAPRKKPKKPKRPRKGTPVSYQTITLMAASQSLQSRMVACAARENVEQPLPWVQQNLWALIAAPGWDTVWDAAVDQSSKTKWNPDIGARDDIITDAMILAAVQERRTELGS